MKQALDQILEGYRQEMIRDICQLVGIPSITGKKEDIQQAMNWFLSKSRQFGFRTFTTRSGDVGIAEIGQGREIIGVLVHVDVVGVGDPDKWSRDPFDCYECEGYLWGRGTIDDKGPVVMSLYALKALADLDIPLNKRIWLIAGTSEESVWTDMRHFIQEYPMPDFGFSPDGDFPIYNVEKGYTDIELHFREPERQQLEDLAAGDSPNTVPSKACLKMVGQEMKCFDGVSVHSSRPQDGENALLKLSNEHPQKEKLAFCKFLSHFFSDPWGSRLGLDDGQAYYQGHFVGSTTVAPTMAWLTEKGVAVNLNIRQRYPVQSRELLDRLQEMGDAWGFVAIMKESLQPMMVDENQEHLQTMKQVAESYGCDGSFQVADGTSYAKSMKNFVSWGPVFPGDESGAHQEDERLSLNSMMLATKMYGYYLLQTATDLAKMARLDSMSSLEKGLYLLELFREPPHRFTLNEVVARTGMNRTTAYRNLSTLEGRGYLTRDANGKAYRLGPSNYMLGNLYLFSGNYEERIYNLLEEIAAQTKESVGMARRDQNQVVSIYSVEAHQSLKMNDRPGTFYPMNKGTYGKCLMAYHDPLATEKLLQNQRFEKTAPNTLTDPKEIMAEYKKIREQGYVLSIEETLSYVVGVGVPLKGKDNRVNNVVAVSFFKQEDYLSKIESIRSVLLQYKPRLEELIP